MPDMYTPPASSVPQMSDEGVHHLTMDDSDPSDVLDAVDEVIYGTIDKNGVIVEETGSTSTEGDADVFVFTANKGGEGSSAEDVTVTGGISKETAENGAATKSSVSETTMPEAKDATTETQNIARGTNRRFITSAQASKIKKALLLIMWPMMMVFIFLNLGSVFLEATLSSAQLHFGSQDSFPNPSNSTFGTNESTTVYEPVVDHQDIARRLDTFILTHTTIPRVENETFQHCTARASSLAQAVFKDEYEHMQGNTSYTSPLESWAGAQCTKHFVPSVRPKSTWGVITSELAQFVLNIKSRLGKTGLFFRDVLREAGARYNMRRNFLRKLHAPLEEVKNIKKVVVMKPERLNGTGAVVYVRLPENTENGDETEVELATLTDGEILKDNTTQTLTSAPSVPTSTVEQPLQTPILNQSVLDSDYLLRHGPTILRALNPFVFALHILRQMVLMVLVSLEAYSPSNPARIHAFPLMRAEINRAINDFPFDHSPPSYLITLFGNIFVDIVLLGLRDWQTSIVPVAKTPVGYLFYHFCATLFLALVGTQLIMSCVQYGPRVASVIRGTGEADDEERKRTREQEQKRSAEQDQAIMDMFKDLEAARAANKKKAVEMEIVKDESEEEETSEGETSGEEGYDIL